MIPPEEVTRDHPALLTCCVAMSRDPHAKHRLLACLLAALRAHGVGGVHACINSTDACLHEFYTKLGFGEIHRTETRVYLARSF
ncbi:Uncharacterized protein OBRU01_16816 [Operophtera brumata]|uniref:N-acetyltransferase domain-containing protein n=1 Tax=Operophtera brumata TaxID=104452 RepID=A0A0L7L1Y5_OPEBR|nr:Uncharacterized protein OBRU01_16816 [Operophtera brumata]